MATLRQQKAVAILAENGGSVGQAMREAGYSDVSSKTPAKLTESDGFKELLDKYLPEEKLLRVGSEGLEANKIISARAKSRNGVPMDADEDTDDFIEVPDHAVRHKFYETGLKIRGKLTGDAGSITNIIVPIVVTRGQGTTQEDRTTPEAI